MFVGLMGRRSLGGGNVNVSVFLFFLLGYTFYFMIKSVGCLMQTLVKALSFMLSSYQVFLLDI